MAALASPGGGGRIATAASPRSSDAICTLFGQTCTCVRVCVCMGTHACGCDAAEMHGLRLHPRGLSLAFLLICAVAFMRPTPLLPLTHTQSHTHTQTLQAKSLLQFFLRPSDQPTSDLSLL